MKTKNIFFILIIFLLIQSQNGLFSQTNLVVNGSFENWGQTSDRRNVQKKDKPIAEHFISGGRNVNYENVFLRHTDSRTGENALRIITSDSHRRFGTAYMNLDTGSYVVKFWLKGEGLLRWVSLTKEGIIPVGSNADGNYIVKPMGGVTDRHKQINKTWTEYTCNFEVKEAGSYSINFSIMYSDNPDIPFLMDDLSMYKTK